MHPPVFTINSDNSITASVPAGSGTVDVEVTNGNGTSAAVTADKYTYTVAPVVTSITPDADLYSSTTTTVTINGLSFSGTPTVMFGTVAGTNVHVISGTQLTVTAPAVSGITANDPVDVTVTVSGNGTSTTNSSDTFTYAVAPTFSAIAPSTGGITGGTPVVITGANFLFNSTLNPNDTTVTFGGIAATSVTVNSATQITAVAPAGTNCRRSKYRCHHSWWIRHINVNDAIHLYPEQYCNCRSGNVWNDGHCKQQSGYHSDPVAARYL